MDPVPVTIKELSSGGMKLFTTVPLPTRFLFTIIFTTPFAKKIDAEAKILHAERTANGFLLGTAFVKIKAAMRSKIDRMARDYTHCERVRAERTPAFCSAACRYLPLCRKKGHKKRSVRTGHGK